MTANRRMRARRKRGVYRRMLSIPGSQFRRLAELSGAESKYVTANRRMRARRKRGVYRRMLSIPGSQFRRLAELGYLERVDVT